MQNIEFYTALDQDNNIVAIYSTALRPNLENYPTVHTDVNMIHPHQVFNEPLFTTELIPRFKWMDGEIVKRSADEMNEAISLLETASIISPETRLTQLETLLEPILTWFNKTSMT